MILTKLLFHPIFLSVLFAYILSQSIKMFILVCHEKEFSIKLIFRRRNMPSSHSATVAALTVSSFLYEGVTPLTIAIFFFSIIVLRDSLGANYGMPKKGKEIIVRGVGRIHSLLEVVVGVGIGAVIGGIIFLIGP
ncbi:MAG: divergent PAP2 family protein [archaeon]|nr:divergent PAP2 family protein [archaeon]MCR4323995.1 divergent PAP2 family protein [Nanoarchaeota archaeon]